MAKIIKFPNCTINLTVATKDYKKNVIKVCNYVSAVANSNLPSLIHPIAEYD